MKISLLQYNPQWENKSFNMSKIQHMLEDKDDLGEVLIFPEMTLTGFTMNAKAMAENLKGESTKYFSALAKKYKISVFAGVIEKNGSRFFNSLIHCDKTGKVSARYKKIHPFSYSTENEYYTAGEKIVVTKVEDWKIGMSICYDLRFPELFRLYAKRKVELIINIANWPDTRVEHWRALLKARAIENQCYVAGVNRVGKDPKLHYNGYSSLFDPMGNEIIANKNKETVLTVDVDISNVNEIRSKLPFLQDIKMI